MSRLLSLVRQYADCGFSLVGATSWRVDATRKFLSIERTRGQMGRAALGLSVIMLCACCGDDSPTGTYALHSINGAPVPYVDASRGFRVYYDTLAFGSRKTFSRSMYYAVFTTGPGDYSSSSGLLIYSGTYGITGAAITLLGSNGSSERKGTFDHNKLTFVESGVTWVYTK